MSYLYIHISLGATSVNIELQVCVIVTQRKQHLLYFVLYHAQSFRDILKLYVLRVEKYCVLYNCCLSMKLLFSGNGLLTCIATKILYRHKLKYSGKARIRIYNISNATKVENMTEKQCKKHSRTIEISDMQTKMTSNRRTHVEWSADKLVRA